MKKKLRKRIRFILIALSLVVILITIKAYSGVNLANEPKTRSVVLKQLNFLEHKLKNDSLGKEMQALFPEGFVFVNALYGLTWCELALNYELDSNNIEKAYKEAKFAYQQIDSDYGKSIFTRNLKPAYGAFYTGWKNYLLGKMISFHSSSRIDSISFKNNCESISEALTECNSPYLETYLGSSWPADVFLCVASLKIHDKIFTPKYDAVIADWIEKVKLHLDPYTGLIPHSTYVESGELIEGARGSSASLILRILSEIDINFAEEQFELYKKHFQISRLGIPAVREYPKGKIGFGDVDSGPVIFKVGFAGTIVSIGVFKTFGELKTATQISRAMEVFGASYSVKKRKRYVFGALPISDAFIAWSRVSPVIDKK